MIHNPVLGALVYMDMHLVYDILSRKQQAQ